MRDEVDSYCTREKMTDEEIAAFVQRATGRSVDVEAEDKLAGLTAEDLSKIMDLIEREEASVAAMNLRDKYND